MRRRQCTRISVYKQHFPWVEGNGETSGRDVWTGISDTMRLMREQPSQISERHNQLGFDNLFNKGLAWGQSRTVHQDFGLSASYRRQVDRGARYQSLQTIGAERMASDLMSLSWRKLSDKFWRWHLHLKQTFFELILSLVIPQIKKKRAATSNNTKKRSAALCPVISLCDRPVYVMLHRGAET